MEKSKKSNVLRRTKSPISSSIAPSGFGSDDTSCSTSSSVPTPKPLSQLRDSLHTILNMMDVNDQPDGEHKSIVQPEVSTVSAIVVNIPKSSQSQYPSSISSAGEVTKSDCENKAVQLRQQQARKVVSLKNSPQKETQKIEGSLAQKVRCIPFDKTANQQNCEPFSETESDDRCPGSMMACLGSDTPDTNNRPVLPCGCVVMSSTSSSGDTSESSLQNVLEKTIMLPADPLCHAHWRENLDPDTQKPLSPPGESAYIYKEQRSECEILLPQETQQPCCCKQVPNKQHSECKISTQNKVCNYQEESKHPYKSNLQHSPKQQCEISHSPGHPCNCHKEQNYSCKCELQHSPRHPCVCSHKDKPNLCKCEISHSPEHPCNCHKEPQMQQFEHKCSQHTPGCSCAHPTEPKQQSQQPQEPIYVDCPLHNSVEIAEPNCSCNVNGKPEKQLQCDCMCHFCSCQQHTENGHYFYPVELTANLDPCYQNNDESFTYPYVTDKPSMSRWKCFCNTLMNGRKQMNRYMLKLKSENRKKLPRRLIFDLVNGASSDMVQNLEEKEEGAKRTMKKSPKKGPLFQTDSRERVDVYYFDHGNSGYYRTTDRQPAARTDMFIDQTEYYVTSFWANIFGTLHLAFAFVVSFILQLLRFLLYSILRPLIIGGIQIVSDYLFKPFLTIMFNGVIQPVLILMYNVATSLRDLCEPIATLIGFFMHELAQVVGAFRLVEVKNSTSIQGRRPCEVLEGKPPCSLVSESKFQRPCSTGIGTVAEIQRPCSRGLDNSTKIQMCYPGNLDNEDHRPCSGGLAATTKAQKVCVNGPGNF